MMRGHSVSVIFLIAMLSVFAADFSVGCGHGYVYGPVTQKFAGGGSDAQEADRQISVNSVPYSVPFSFFQRIEVGDTVKFDGRTWTIVKRANAPTPTSPPP